MSVEKKQTEEIVCKVFEKAKEKCAKHSKYALSKYIGEHIDLSSKTLERAYDRYILKDRSINVLSAYSINVLCQYLEYENYEHYITATKEHIKKEITNENHVDTIINDDSETVKKSKRRFRFSFYIGFKILASIILNILY